MGKGTKESPWLATDAMTLAREMFESNMFTREGGRQGLWSFRRHFLVWEAGRWKRVEWDGMVDRVLLGLEGTHQMVGGPTTIKTMEMSPRKAEDVVRCLKAISACEVEVLPRWMGEEVKTAPGTSIGFLDKVVDVAGGGLEVVERDEGWLDPFVVPVEWEKAKDAECPTWEKCLREWGEGEDWRELAGRVVGYLMMGHRRYHKLFLLQGLGRGGKSTFDGVVRMLCGGGYFSTDSRRLGDSFGLENAVGMKVIGVQEAHNLTGNEGEATASVMKRVLSGDPLEVNGKNVRATAGVRVHAAVVMVSNPIPRLPDHGLGISAKMVPLPFLNTFLGAEDFELEEKLRRELPGVARWAVEGARRLEGEKEAAKKWTLTAGGKEILERYRLLSNLWDSFLEDRFVKSGDGWVLGEIVLELWGQWVAENGIKEYVPKNHVLARIVSESTWGVRKGQVGGGRERGRVALFGVGVRAVRV